MTPAVTVGGRPGARRPGMAGLYVAWRLLAMDDPPEVVDPDFDPDPAADRPDDGGGLPASLDHFGMQLTYFDDSPGAAR